MSGSTSASAAAHFGSSSSSANAKSSTASVTAVQAGSSHYHPVELRDFAPVAAPAPSSHVLLLASDETGPYSVMRASKGEARVFRLRQHLHRIALALATTTAKRLAARGGLGKSSNSNNDFNSTPSGNVSATSAATASATAAAAAAAVGTAATAAAADENAVSELLCDAVAVSLRKHTTKALTLFRGNGNGNKVYSSADSNSIAGAGAGAGAGAADSAETEPEDVRILYLLTPRSEGADALTALTTLDAAAFARNNKNNIKSTANSSSSSASAPVTAAAAASASTASSAEAEALAAAIEAAYHVTLHLSPLPPRPSPPVCAVARPAVRPHGHIKDSRWVREAEMLEKSMKRDENEVVMYDPVKKSFSEGISSNFFALIPKKSLNNKNNNTKSTTSSNASSTSSSTRSNANAAATAIPSARSQRGSESTTDSANTTESGDVDFTRWTLVTASEGVLLGTVRATALAVARALGVAVDECAGRGRNDSEAIKVDGTKAAAAAVTAAAAAGAGPELGSVAEWGGCAVSSTSRLFLPIDRLRVPGVSREQLSQTLRHLHPQSQPPQSALIVEQPDGELVAVFGAETEGRRVMAAIQRGVDDMLWQESTPLFNHTSN